MWWMLCEVQRRLKSYAKVLIFLGESVKILQVLWVAIWQFPNGGGELRSWAEKKNRKINTYSTVVTVLIGGYSRRLVISEVYDTYVYTTISTIMRLIYYYLLISATRLYTSHSRRFSQRLRHSDVILGSATRLYMFIVIPTYNYL